ncbi:hypothetical protein H206_05499 [Candidatus Electrothrix aarhusensis]|uniref:Uncharacterized protein n=1 Tax=Candidatus Electrothrix aarhusensis TaxID=1859131 RepID=A0A444J491_9BACT|nr:hypothetical protein H206_05499 [Candidatus Electrothrix aarhusensis]
MQSAQGFLGRRDCLGGRSPGVFVGGQLDGVFDAVFAFQFLQGFAWGIGDDVGYVFWDVEFHGIVIFSGVVTPVCFCAVPDGTLLRINADNYSMFCHVLHVLEKFKRKGAGLFLVARGG